MSDSDATADRINRIIAQIQELESSNKEFGEEVQEFGGDLEYLLRKSKVQLSELRQAKRTEAKVRRLFRNAHWDVAARSGPPRLAPKGKGKNDALLDSAQINFNFEEFFIPKHPEEGSPAKRRESGPQSKNPVACSAQAKPKTASGKPQAERAKRDEKVSQIAQIAQVAQKAGPKSELRLSRLNARDLPSSVLLNVIGRLEITNLLQLRGVCRSWRLMIHGFIRENHRCIPAQVLHLNSAVYAAEREHAALQVLSARLEAYAQRPVSLYELQTELARGINREELSVAHLMIGFLAHTGAKLNQEETACILQDNLASVRKCLRLDPVALVGKHPVQLERVQEHLLRPQFRLMLEWMQLQNLLHEAKSCPGLNKWIDLVNKRLYLRRC